MNCLELGIASIKMQKFQCIYPISKGFYLGTIFQELDKPWGETKC